MKRSDTEGGMHATACRKLQDEERAILKRNYMPKYPSIKVKVKLTGTDGNAFFVLGTVVHAMRKARLRKDEIGAFINEAMSSDYDHLLQTVLRYVHIYY